MNEILQVEDNSSASDAIDHVRRTFPGLVCPSYAVDTLKNKFKKECEAVLKQERCQCHRRENSAQSPSYLPPVCLSLVAGD